MASELYNFWRCMFSPKLVKMYGTGPVGKVYVPATFEKWGDQVIQSFYIIWKIGLYTSPLIVGILYRRGYFDSDGLLSVTKLITGIGTILIVSYCLRSFGRYSSPVYQKFLGTLERANEKMTPANKRELAQYDFDFDAWPVEFSAGDVSAIEGERYEHRIYITRPQNSRNALQSLSAIPCHLLGYLAVHTFGIRMIYPGSVGLLQMLLQSSLLQGRSLLVQVNRGQRFKLKSRDGNEIDSMFVDKRNSSNQGNMLVICCEGNAGFYEMGIMSTPIEAGYSTLGWNHPGFGGSTGIPYPSQEQNAIEIVMQFAMYKLGFPIENILLYGWSIGGYSSTWAAMNFPKVKGVVLDASFDDLIPLAMCVMPTWADSIVRLAVREYVNLNNYEQLSKYPGPVLLIRRTEDEVIATTQGNIGSNRGNYLLTKLLRSRYPQIFDDVVMKLINEYLSLNSANGQEQFVQPYMVNPDACRQELEAYINEHSRTYPLMIGEKMSLEKKQQFGIFLVRKHIKDYNATHCTPLPPDMFSVPWDVNIETDYVMP